jgi:hypothetical protein
VRVLCWLGLGVVLVLAVFGAVVRCLFPPVVSLDGCLLAYPVHGSHHHSISPCSCTARELTDAELAERRGRAAGRARRLAEIYAQLDELDDERSTYEAARDVCRNEASRCDLHSAWNEPLVCIGRGFSGEPWRSRADGWWEAAAGVRSRRALLEHEQEEIEVTACCDHLLW